MDPEHWAMLLAAVVAFVGLLLWYGLGSDAADMMDDRYLPQPKPHPDDRAGRTDGPLYPRDR